MVNQKEEDYVHAWQQIVAVICFLYCTLLSGCMSFSGEPAVPVPMASSQMDAEAKSFTPAPGKANIYVIRKSRFAGSSLSHRIILDGKRVGELRNSSYLMIAVNSGDYVVGMKPFYYGASKITHLTYDENVSSKHSTKIDVVPANISVESGENYFISYDHKTGWNSFTWTFRQISDVSGRKFILKHKRCSTEFAMPPKTP